jgi:hypothetical protein
VAATVDVTKLGSTTQKPLVIAARRGRNLDPSSKIRLYSLAWSAHGKRWEPRVFADLTLRQQEYHGTWQRHPGKTARVAFVHDAAGPEAAAAVWRQRLDAAVIASDTRRLELLSARSSLPQGMAAVDSVGHFGMRIGQQMASGSELLSGAQYVSLYAEATGRYIGGLRASLELVPTVSAEIDGATQEFGWRRAGIGYAFGFNIPWLIDRIEVVPRATVWTFKAVVPYANFDEGAPEEFKVDNQLSHGVNVAVISLLGDFLVKPWYGRDIELPLDELKVGSVVQTTMVGLDLYFSQPSWRLWNRPVGLLAFALGEQITILKGGKDADDVRRSIEIRDMFAGLGTLMAF